jgi:hypothetical protein
MLSDALASVKNLDSTKNSSFDDSKFMGLNGPDITGVHVADLLPLLLAKVGRFRGLAVTALHFDNAGALGQLRSVVALLGDIPVSPEPESAVYLYE